MNPKVKAETWMNHIGAWKKSGLSINKYCRDNGLKATTFHYWYKQIKKQGIQPASESGLVKLEISDLKLKTKVENISLKYGSFEIIIPEDFNGLELGRLLDVLKVRSSC